MPLTEFQATIAELLVVNRSSDDEAVRETELRPVAELRYSRRHDICLANRGILVSKRITGP